MQWLEQAAQIFPYDRYIRTTPAYFAIINYAPSEDTVALIGSVLRTDPFSADLTNGLALHAYGIRNDFLANSAWRAFTKLAPNSPRTEKIKSALERLQ